MNEETKNRLCTKITNVNREIGSMDYNDGYKIAENMREITDILSDIVFNMEVTEDESTNLSEL